MFAADARVGYRSCSGIGGARRFRHRPDRQTRLHRNMGRLFIRVGLALGGVGCIIAAIASGDHLAAAPTVDRPERARPRTGPGEDTVRERKRRALRELAARTAGPSRAVTVRVMDCGLVPASGAEVAVVAGGVEVRGEADELGVFRGLVPDDAEAVAAVATLEAASGPRRGEAAAVGAEVSISVCPGAVVSGVVRDAEGRPLRDATVRFGDDEDVAVTEDDGEFVLTDAWLTADRILVAHATGAAEVALAPPLAPGEERALDLVVEPGRRAVGAVVDAHGGPAPNVEVMAVDARGEVVARATADRDGRFWLRRLPLDALTIRADGGPRGVGEVALTAGTGGGELVVRLGDNRGTLVVVWEGGAPGAITASGSGLADSIEDPTPAALTLASGAPVVVPAPAVYRAVVHVAGGEVACGEGALFAGQRLELRCGRARAATVLARIVGPDGRPAVGIPWVLQAGDDGAPLEASGTTDAAGRIAASLTIDRATSAALAIGRPPGGVDGVSRRNLALSPGARLDLGDLALRDREAVTAMFTERETGSFGGLGGQLRADDLGVAFSRIVRDGPLDQAGVRKGDVVLGIDGEPAGQLTEREVLLRLRGEPGTAVDLRLLRPGEGQLQIELDRAIIDVEGAGWVD